MSLGCLGDFLCYFEAMFDNFSTRATQLVFAARLKAGERGAAVVDTDDLLVGLALEDQRLLLKSLFPDVEEKAFVWKSLPRPHVPLFSHKLAEDLLTALKKSLPRSEPVPETIGEQSKQCPLSSSRPSRGDPFPAVFVMEAAENPARRDPAVLGEGMSIVTLPRQENRRRFRNPWSEAQMGTLLVVMSHPLCHDSAQMFLSQRNHEIQTLPA